MANASRQNQFNTGDVLLEASLEGEFDYIYNCLDGTNTVDINCKGDLTVQGGDITVSGAATAIAVIDNTAAALSVKESTTTYLDVDTSDGLECVGIVGNDIIKPNQQLTTGDFPNTTTLYVWSMDSTVSENQTDVVGSKVLTLAAGALTSANDVLGNAKYCAFDGSTYLQSTDTAFNIANTADTDDFMVGGWVYLPDTTPAATTYLFSNIGATNNGWGVLVGTAGAIWGRIDLATDLDTSYHTITTVSSGWFHIVFTREVGVGTKFYINGALVGSGSDGTMGTTQSKFQLGGFNGATSLPESGTRYDECFFKKGTLPTNLNDTVRQIYARSAKKFAVKDANSNIWIPEQNVASGVYTPTATLISGMDSCTPTAAIWTRVGNVVTVTGALDIDLTAADVLSYADLSLPIATTASTATDLRGVCKAASAGYGGGYFYLNAYLARLQMSSYAATSKSYGYTLSYIIK